jgi:hypothetical protein
VKRHSGRRLWACTALGVVAVVAAQQAWVSPCNFQGADEWLGIELASRGRLTVPYANRPLVFFWLAVAQRVWPDDLAAYWAFTGLAFVATGLLTAALVRRSFPRAPVVALLAGVFAASWAPTDWLRLDTTLIAGYAGFTASTLLALVLFVESWWRRSRALLLCGGAVGLLSGLGVEGVIPILAAGPLLLAPRISWRGDRAGLWRLARWAGTWEGFVLVSALFAAAPALAGIPSYQTGALKLDASPIRIAGRLVQLLGMQLTPLVTSAARELAHPAVPLAVAAVALAAVLAWRAAPRASRGVRAADAGLAFALGLALACAAHLGLALAAHVRDPVRSQVLSTPGFGLALAAAFTATGARLRGRLSRLAPLALAAWTAAVGTGRVVAIQAEWDAWRNAYPDQRRTLADLVRQAPALRPNTLVVLLNGVDTAFPLGFTFRHAVALLYPGQAIGLVRDGEPFVYPWYLTPGGIVVVPWPVIREPWGVRPSQHRWDEIVAVRSTADGLEVCREWPERELGPLPEGGSYRPDARIVPAAAPPPSRRLLSRLR